MTATKIQPVATSQGRVRDLTLLAFEVLVVAAIGTAASQQFLRLKQAVASFDGLGAGHWLRQLVLDQARSADPAALVLAGAVAGAVAAGLLVLAIAYLASAATALFIVAGPAARDRSPDPADVSGQPAGETLVLAETVSDLTR